MSSVRADTRIRELQQFIKEVYSQPNDRHFELSEMLVNIQRFAMRGLKGIRKYDVARTKKNLIVSFCWFLSTLNRLHIDLEEEVWKRFPYTCSYCGTVPCSCKEKKVETRQELSADPSKRPRTLQEVQAMFEAIYPASRRTLDSAGVHLAEEVGEFSEALLTYRGARTDEGFNEVMLEAADYFSCIMGIFNSLHINLAQELSLLFTNNCYVCKHAPCTCSFQYITAYKE
jgi:NTP pyrophosphatase (non-canonical NTP hydrolase)